jgi:cytochrome P450
VEITSRTSITLAIPAREVIFQLNNRRVLIVCNRKSKMISNISSLQLLFQCVLIFVCSAVLYLLFHLRYYFFPRKYQFPETYPFASTIRIIGSVDRALDELLDVVREVKKRFDRKSVILNTIGVSHLVITGDVENITYILKTNFENFGKTGHVFKPKFQELLGNGIFNADGHTWYAHRKTSALIFKLNRFKTSVLEVFHDDMDQCIEWIRSKPKNTPFDLHGLMHRFTLESIARLAFGLKFDVIRKERVQFAEDFDFCTYSINNSMMDPMWMIKRYCTPSGWKYFAAIRRINQFVSKIISERRATIAAQGGKVTADMNDLLSLYLDKGTFQQSEEHEQDNNRDDTYLEPNDSTLRDVILNMIIAGRDTTAQALSWAFYRMCIHNLQDKLRTEIITVLKEADEYEVLKGKQGYGTISYETLQSMKYLEAFIMEVLRLHPSVPKEAKCVFKDDVLPDGTQVKQGDLMIFLPWCMGRDPDLWGDDCLDFKPERFLDKNSRPSPFVFTAFQAGPRTCLGQNFALLEMKTAIARMLLIYSFALAQDANSITYENSLTLPMRGGMLVTAQEI